MFLTCLATNQVVVGCFANADFLFDKIVASLVAKQVCGKTRKMSWQILLRKIVRTIFSTCSFCKNLQPDCCFSGMLQNKLHVFQIFQCLGEAVMEKTAGFSHFLLPSPPSLSFSGLNSVQLSRGCIESHKKTHTHTHTHTHTPKKWRHVKCLEVTAILPFEIIFFWGQSFTKQKAFNFTLRHLCHHLKLKVNPVWTQQVNVNRLVSLANGYYCAQFYHNSTF